MLDEIIEEALAVFENDITESEIQVIRGFTDIPSLEMDKHGLIQILVNLISNANQAISDHSGSNRTLRLTTQKEDDSVSVIVQDSGIGISKENLVSIFSHGFTTKKDGHGFGLHGSAVRAKEMGGELQVQSNGVGKGATFTLTLPFTPTVGPQ